MQVYLLPKLLPNLKTHEKYVVPGDYKILFMLTIILELRNLG
jgi:hypothetical protein